MREDGPQWSLKRALKSAIDVTIAPMLTYCLTPTIKYVLSQPAFHPDIKLRDKQSGLRAEIDRLRLQISGKTPDNPCLYGFKTFAQTDEDGIIENILDRIANHSKTFIEIGCGKGIENNSHYLLLKGYKGCWVDGSEKNIAFIKAELGALEFDDLIVRREFISVENIGAIIQSFCIFIGTTEPGIFSLDIDGNELYVMREALKHFRPQSICAEYNPKFPPPFSSSIVYNATKTWSGDDYHGASLQAFCDLLIDYKLVSCNLSGANAFFVRKDFSSKFSDYTSIELFQPFRENLIDLRPEHYPSMRWLRDKLVAKPGHK